MAPSDIDEATRLVNVLKLCRGKEIWTVPSLGAAAVSEGDARTKAIDKAAEAGASEALLAEAREKVAAREEVEYQDS